MSQNSHELEEIVCTAGANVTPGSNADTYLIFESLRPSGAMVPDRDLAVGKRFVCSKCGCRDYKRAGRKPV